VSLADLAARGYVTEEWSHWQQGNCGGYAAALIHHFPHLRLGGIDFWDHRDTDTGELYDNPGHYVAHDGIYAYDSAGRHLLPYKGVDGSGRWLDFSDMPAVEALAHFGLTEHYGECGDYDDAERAAVLAHATKHNILPLEVRHDATV
jgi:hypothetical protein